MKRRCPGRALGPPGEFCFEVADVITAGNPNRPTPDHLVHDLEPHDDCVAGCLRGPVLGWGSPVGDCLEWVAWLAGRATVSATSGAWASNGGYGFGSFRRWPRWVVSNRGSVSWHAKKGHSVPPTKSRPLPPGDPGALPNHDSSGRAAIFHGRLLQGHGLATGTSPADNTEPAGGTASPDPLPSSRPPSRIGRSHRWLAGVLGRRMGSRQGAVCGDGGARRRRGPIVSSIRRSIVVFRQVGQTLEFFSNGRAIPARIEIG